MRPDAPHSRLSRPLGLDRSLADVQDGAERRAEVPVVVLGQDAIAGRLSYLGEHESLWAAGDPELGPVPEDGVSGSQAYLIRSDGRRCAVQLEHPPRLAGRGVTSDLVDVGAETAQGDVVVELAEHARRFERVERVLRQSICTRRRDVDQGRGLSEDRPLLALDRKSVV